MTPAYQLPAHMVAKRNEVEVPTEFSSESQGSACQQLGFGYPVEGIAGAYPPRGAQYTPSARSVSFRTFREKIALTLGKLFNPEARNIMELETKLYYARWGNPADSKGISEILRLLNAASPTQKGYARDFAQGRRVTVLIRWEYPTEGGLLGYIEGGGHKHIRRFSDRSLLDPVRRSADLIREFEAVMLHNNKASRRPIAE